MIFYIFYIFYVYIIFHVLHSKSSLSSHSDFIYMCLASCAHKRRVDTEAGCTSFVPLCLRYACTYVHLRFVFTSQQIIRRAGKPRSVKSGDPIWGNCTYVCLGTLQSQHHHHHHHHHHHNHHHHLTTTTTTPATSSYIIASRCRCRASRVRIWQAMAIPTAGRRRRRCRAGIARSAFDGSSMYSAMRGRIRRKSPSNAPAARHLGDGMLSFH